MLQKPASSRKALVSYTLILPVAALLLMCTQSENEQPKSASARQSVKIDGEVLTQVEQTPEFPGGMAALGGFLSENLKYPAAAQKASIEGKVFVSFVVTKTGEIADVSVLKGIRFGTDEEAKRVVSLKPRWTPAHHKGKLVNVRFYLPINFQLTEKTAQLPFFSIPTTDDEIQQQFKHFIVNGKEVAFDEFRTYSKGQIVEASSSKQSIYLETSL